MLAARAGGGGGGASATGPPPPDAAARSNATSKLAAALTGNANTQGLAPELVGGVAVAVRELAGDGTGMG